jgi:hypothetical protein
MKAMLFLGSGVSLPSGLPTTEDLTQSLLNDDWFDHGDNNFFPGHHPSYETYLPDHNIVPLLQKFLKLLKRTYDKYLISRRGMESNYEDLFYLCQQMDDELSGEVDNPMIIPFLTELNNRIDFLSESMPNRPGVELNIKYLASRCLDLIQCVIWNRLSYKGEPQDLNLIIELVHRPDLINLDIATLNHDLLLELLFSNKAIEYNDGFNQPDGDIRYFEHILFKKKSKINLFKLHGSINWYWFRTPIETNGQQKTIDRYVMTLNPDNDHCKDSSGQMLTDLGGRPIFLTGSYNKLSSYNFGIINKMHHYFDESLYSHDIIIMSGYGWNDKGINGRLFEWILSSPDKRIILLHQHPEDLKRSKSAMWHRYDGLVENGRLVTIKKWLSETKIEDITQHIK